MVNVNNSIIITFHGVMHQKGGGEVYQRHLILLNIRSVSIIECYLFI